ncbi:MAG: hypothetical protein Q8N35_10265 [Methylococcaceae bacterium]|uniref:hypothetical protein n=1 Tax=Methylicorpusculum sp. TaxID=2713644 RepID=UPI0027230495|nr:hypothetical protein [Methylicorpusculum sp.]MDO9161800.1 hypothetical protein [Methylococcaceae bacterium]MDP2394553.1 hypothetical protein [Methylococcaceae bacterium]MDP3019962.1 hypothetical protein [Methylococcaceae bacterium]MDP3389267.1 hypothetical protein [Methylococcaceae bacterium]MDP3932277.1 hypothetical protein [Methylococcaceae bacterium]
MSTLNNIQVSHAGNGMALAQKQSLKLILSTLVIGNTVLFLVMAYFHLLSTDAKSAVFIDFWGRFTVYSLWFIGFAIYVKYLARQPMLKGAILAVIVINIPLFLLLAYFDKISNTPDMIVFVDFWGRITVYSLWFICYEVYRKYVGSVCE